MKALAWLKALPTAVQLGAVVVVLAGSLFGAWSLHERSVGALAATIKTERAQHDTALRVALAARDTALRAAETASAALAHYHANAPVVTAATGHSDSAVRTLASARDAALAAVADVTRSADSLRVTIQQLVSASDSAEAAHALERAVFQRRLAAAASVMQLDSLAIASGQQALAAMERRAATAEAMAKTLQKMQPSKFWEVAKLAAAGVGGFGLAKATN